MADPVLNTLQLPKLYNETVQSTEVQNKMDSFYLVNRM